MKKAGIFIMVVSFILGIYFIVSWFHPVTDNAVDSTGSWSYMYGIKSVPWPVFSAGVTFLMGLTIYMSTWEQKSRRYN